MGTQKNIPREPKQRVTGARRQTSFGQKTMTAAFQPRKDLTAQHFRDAFNSGSSSGVLVTMSVDEGNVLPIDLAHLKRRSKRLPFDMAASVMRKDASWRLYHMAAPPIAWGYAWDPRDNDRAVLAGAPYDCFSTWRHMRTGEFVWTMEIYVGTLAVLGACAMAGVHHTLAVRWRGGAVITWNVLAWTAALTVLAQLLDCTMCWQHPLATKSCIRRVLAFRRDHCPRLQCRYTEYYAAVISGAAILGTCAWVFTRGMCRRAKVACAAWAAISGAAVGGLAVGGTRLNPVYGPDVDLWTEFITMRKRRDRETMPYDEAFEEFRRHGRPPPSVLLLVLRGRPTKAKVTHSLDTLKTMLVDECPRVLVVWYAHPCGQPRFIGLVAYNRVADLVDSRLAHGRH